DLHALGTLRCIRVESLREQCISFVLPTHFIKDTRAQLRLLHCLRTSFWSSDILRKRFTRTYREFERDRVHKFTHA
ncbi:MAG: hypothetical protein RIR10_172, partial [Planctomycetota bacterium]